MWSLILDSKDLFELYTSQNQVEHDYYFKIFPL